MARFSSARGIGIDRDAVAGPGPRRRVTVDAGSGGSTRLSVSDCLLRTSLSFRLN